MTTTMTTTTTKDPSVTMPHVTPANLFHGLPEPAVGEVFDDVLRCGNLVIERIVSSPVPEPVLYDQPQHEWVLLLAGSAVLELDGESVALAAGDHLFIPAHCPHRVLSTSAEPRCLWLAVHLWPEGRTADAGEPPPSSPPPASEAD
jgi:cupin 2 domain-containing protein